jgi:hemoglobin/transferrin/lactoferrin receptor protein
VQVDGVDKSFEKYRFGGTFIEPELIKSIEVRRGAHIESGAGALGGSVLASTKDAADLLRRGQRFGARVRLGHGWNNAEDSRMVALYGRPSDQWDLLLASSTRRSNDFKLPDGSAIELSAADASSDLFKASWFPADHWALTASWLRYADQALTAYDATGGDPGLFGQVQRRIDDETASLQLKWSDPQEGHRFKATVGQSTTHVRDHFEPWMKSFVSNARTGSVDDDIRYQSQNLDAQATWQLWRQEAHELALNMGWQVAQGQRQVTRQEAIRSGRYPDGFNAAQPPGGRQSQGAFLQLDGRWQGWQAQPGWRWDQVRLRAQGRTQSVLAQAGQSTEVAYEHGSPSLTLTKELVPRRWTVSAQVAKSFRPPLIDEVFMQGAYGRCLDAVLTRGVAGYAPRQKVAPASGICGDLYQIERARSSEVSVSTDQPDRLGEGSRLQARLVAFEQDTEHLLESLLAVPGGSGRLHQPGWESRHGVEFEATALWPLTLGEGHRARLSTQLAFSVLKGQMYDGRQVHDLTTAPARAAAVSIGWQQGAWRTSVRWRRVSDRVVVMQEAYPSDRLGRQPGYHLIGLSLQWQINTYLEAQLTADNLENTLYRLIDASGGGMGTLAPGRQVRLALTGRY